MNNEELKNKLIENFNKYGGAELSADIEIATRHAYEFNSIREIEKFFNQDDEDKLEEIKDFWPKDMQNHS